MESKVCCFIGHRKIDKSVELTQIVSDIINDLMENKGVATFLFGSRSEFDDLCHSIVTELQKNNPQYLPSRRKYSKRDVSEYQLKSGTALAFEYAMRGKYIKIINIWSLMRKIE